MFQETPTQEAGASGSDRPGSWSPEKRSRLLELIRERTLFVNREEGFELSSGRRSPFIFNLKNLYGRPEPAALITDALLDRLAGMECDCIAGLELGAVFPVTTVVAASQYTNRPTPGFVIRKEPKGYGTLNRVEGLAKQDPRNGTLVVLDDVTTTGNSLYEAVQVARDLGFTVNQAITLVDREEGAVETLKEKGVELLPLFTKREFPKIPRDSDAS